MMLFFNKFVHRNIKRISLFISLFMIISMAVSITVSAKVLDGNELSNFAKPTAKSDIKKSGGKTSNDISKNDADKEKKETGNAKNKEADNAKNKDADNAKNKETDNAKNKDAKTSDLDKNKDELINDSADLISDAVEKEIVKKMQEVIDKYNVDFRIVTAVGVFKDQKTVIDSMVDEYIQKYYREKNIGKDHNGDGILLLILPDVRKYMFRYQGKCEKLVTKKDDNKLCKSFESYIKKDDYNGAVKYYTNNVGGKIKSHILKNYAIAMGASLLIGLIVALIFKSKLNNAVPKESAGDYVKDDSFSVTNRSDLYTHMTVTRTKIQKESSSSGHYSSSSGGGRSSGGSY